MKITSPIDVIFEKVFVLHPQQHMRASLLLCRQIGHRQHHLLIPAQQPHRLYASVAPRLQHRQRVHAPRGKPQHVPTDHRRHVDAEDGVAATHGFCCQREPLRGPVDRLLVRFDFSRDPSVKCGHRVVDIVRDVAEGCELRNPEECEETRYVRTIHSVEDFVVRECRCRSSCARVREDGNRPRWYDATTWRADT